MQLEDRGKWNVTETVAYHAEWDLPSSPLPNWSGSLWAPASRYKSQGTEEFQDLPETSAVMNLHLCMSQNTDLKFKSAGVKIKGYLEFIYTL